VRKPIVVVGALGIISLASAYAQTTSFGFFELMKTGTPQGIQTSLDQGGNLHARDGQGRTPLMYAAEYNQNPVVITLLLKAGADVKARDSVGMTALMYAAVKNQNPEVISTLLEAGADVNARDKDGETALIAAATLNQNTEVISVLLKGGADINAKMQYGRTALQIAAARNQNPEVIMVLLKAGADVRGKDNFGHTAFDLAQTNVKLKGTDAYWKLNEAQYGNETNKAVTFGDYRVVWDQPDANKGRTLLSRVDPKLPPWVSKQGLTLAVTVSFVVMPDGVVSVVSIDRSTGYADVDSAFKDAIRRWRFSAAKEAGPMTGLIPYVIKSQ